MADGRFIRVIRRKEVLALAFGAMIGWCLFGEILLFIRKKQGKSRPYAVHT